MKSIFNIMSLNMKINLEHKHLGLMTLPNDPLDTKETKYKNGYDEKLASGLWRLTQIAYCDRPAII